MRPKPRTDQIQSKWRWPPAKARPTGTLAFLLIFSLILQQGKTIQSFNCYKSPSSTFCMYWIIELCMGHDSWSTARILTLKYQITFYGLQWDLNDLRPCPGLICLIEINFWWTFSWLVTCWLVRSVCITSNLLNHNYLIK